LAPAIWFVLAATGVASVALAVLALIDGDYIWALLFGGYSVIAYRLNREQIDTWRGRGTTDE
jgi:hypothetical protein